MVKPITTSLTEKEKRLSFVGVRIPASLRAKLEGYVDRRQLSSKIIQLLELSVDEEGTIAAVDEKIMAHEECSRQDGAAIKSLKETRASLLRTQQNVELAAGREGALRAVIRDRLTFFRDATQFPTPRIAEVVATFSGRFNIPAVRARELFKEEIGR